MKKFLKVCLICLMISMSFLFVACTDSFAGNDNNDNPPATQPSANKVLEYKDELTSLLNDDIEIIELILGVSFVTNYISNNEKFIYTYTIDDQFQIEFATDLLNEMLEGDISIFKTEHNINEKIVYILKTTESNTFAVEIYFE